MKKQITQKFILAGLVLCLSIASSYAQKKDWGIGGKIGDPTGVTLKKYIGNNNAFELVIGIPQYIFGRGYHRHNLNNNFGYNYNSNSIVAIQFHYLMHHDLDQVLQGLDWYFGFGPQARFRTFDRGYPVYNQWGQTSYYNYETRVGMDLGIDGVAGAEYSFKNFPFSVFAEVGLFAAMIFDAGPVRFRPIPQIGTGARFNF